MCSAHPGSREYARLSGQRSHGLAAAMTISLHPIVSKGRTNTLNRVAKGSAACTEGNQDSRAAQHEVKQRRQWQR